MRKDRSKSCYVCETSGIEYFFDCGNGLCLDCIREHIKAQLDKYRVKIFSKSLKFICAGSCKCEANTEKMVKLMDSEIRNIYEEVLLKMYLNQTKDITSCPNSKCNNYGIMRQDCTCFECNICGHKWTCEEEISLNLFSLDNIKSTFKKYMIAKICNNCKSPIERNEGCVHMECNRCDYSFCWRCTENWIGHSEYVCMGLMANEWEESFRPDFLSILYLFLIFTFTFKLIFTFTISFIIIYHLLKVVLLLGMLVLNAFYLRWVIRLIKTFRRKIVCVNIIPLIVIEGILYWFGLHPYSEKVYSYLVIGVYIPTIIVSLRRI
jgi:hypothetical protein